MLWRRSVEEHYHLVGMSDIQVAAQQFPSQIGIGMARIQQRNTVFKLVTFFSEPSYFSLPLGQQPLMLAPGNQSTGTGKREAAHDKQTDQSDALRQTFPGQSGFLAKLPHSSLES